MQKLQLTLLGLVLPCLSFQPNQVSAQILPFIPAGKESVLITQGTEHRVWYSLGGEFRCFRIRSVNGDIGTADFRRTHAGKQKRLGRYTGRVCLDSKFPSYVLYATPVGGDVIVTREEKGEGEDWRPGDPNSPFLMK